MTELNFSFLNSCTNLCFFCQFYSWIRGWVGVGLVGDIPFHPDESLWESPWSAVVLREHFHPGASFHDMAEISWNPRISWRSFEHTRMPWLTLPGILQVVGPKDRYIKNKILRCFWLNHCMCFSQWHKTFTPLPWSCSVHLLRGLL